ncbi:nucleotide disphospho-sugar-binding domain-containing protein [Streptomyces syringium]|uniref:glycosyltransferase n=1 Tax=Streptomyces syringium TaxID=76729 RepID=UPI003444036A
MSVIPAFNITARSRARVRPRRLRRGPRRCPVATRGSGAEHLPSADPRIKVVEHVPQPALLRRADLFVTHGGRASLHDAVQGATPVLGMGVLADQPDNTAAFARRGLGLALDPTAPRGEIAAAMTAVLSSSRYNAAMSAAESELSQLPPLNLAEVRDSLQREAVSPRPPDDRPRGTRATISAVTHMISRP